MPHYYWNDWYFGFGWLLWFGFIFLVVASLGNWGYTYRAHRKVEDVFQRKNALDFLNERYARGEIQQGEYRNMKAEIMGRQLDKPAQSQTESNVRPS